MKTDVIRVALLDDHSKIHLAISALLAEIDDIVLVAQGHSGDMAVDLCHQYQPHVMLMDVIMPGMSGIEATRAVINAYPDMKVLALSGFMDRDSILAMLEAGAVGYVLKASPTEDLVNTIRTAYDGNAVISQEVMQSIIQRQTISPVKKYGLTRREVDVLCYIVEGMTNPEIAGKMHVSVSTIKFHVINLLQKLHVSTRTEAVSRAIEENLV